MRYEDQTSVARSPRTSKFRGPSHTFLHLQLYTEPPCASAANCCRVWNSIGQTVSFKLLATSNKRWFNLHGSESCNKATSSLGRSDPALPFFCRWRPRHWSCRVHYAHRNRKPTRQISI